MPDLNDPYWGMDPSCFGNLKKGDRVKRYNILGTYVWHEGTVQGFCMSGGLGVFTGNPLLCRVLVKWDDVGTSRADGCCVEFPDQLTKM